MSSPFHKICPPVGLFSPMMALAREVLPPPLGPVITQNAPSGTVSDTSRRMSFCPASSSTEKARCFSSNIVHISYRTPPGLAPGEIIVCFYGLQYTTGGKGCQENKS